MLTAKPKVAWITTNLSCNFRCKWCYARNQGFDGGKTMSLPLSLRLLSIIKDLEIKQIDLIGGEPTLWEPLLRFNRESRACGIKTTIVTNGERFSDDLFWSGYLKSPNDRVSPSIKAFDEESGKSLAHISNWQQLRLGLSRLASEFGCGASLVYNSFVRGKLLQLVTFARECGANSVSISPCTPSVGKRGPSTTGMIPIADLVTDIVSQYQKLHELMDGRMVLSLKTPLCVWPRDFISLLMERRQLCTGCQFQNRTGVIFDPAGNLLACNGMSEFPTGEIDQDFHDANSLLRLLNSEEVSTNHDRINSYPSNRCIDCEHKDYCGGGCPLMWTVFDAQTLVPGR